NLNDLKEFISNSPNFKELLTTIHHFIDRKGNIKDNSTEELKKIRKEIYYLTQQIPLKLNDFIKENSQYLISDQVGYKNGRFVVYLNSQYVNIFDGIVQEYSWTHKTAFFEPHFIIKYNNQLTVLQNLEKIEIQKILSALFEKISENLKNLSKSIKICGLLEFLNEYFTLSQYFCYVENQKREIQITELINPLIKNCIAIDIKFDKGLMIVGPNNGGKSVTLKSLALSILLSNVGLPIPAKYANIPYLRVFYDIPDPQDINQGISTFYGHVKYWKYIIDNLENESIVIMDEPASGTDPSEASIITIALIEYFLEKNSFVAFSTHYEQVKNYFYGKITTASLNFDPLNPHNNHKLIYNIILPSLPTNLLFEIPQIKEKINQIRQYLSSSHYQEKLNQILQDIIKLYEEIAKEKEKITQELKKLEQRNQELKEKLKNEIFSKLYLQYSKEIEKIIENWEKELEKIKNSGNIQKLDKKIKTIKNFDLKDYLSSLESQEEPPQIKKGDFVKIKLFDEIGTVKEIKQDRLTVEVNGKIYYLSTDQVKKVSI
ncbi:MAG: MutS-related protein, partial [bacterium]